MGVFKSLKKDDEKKTAETEETAVTEESAAAEDTAAADKKKSAKASAKQHYLTGKEIREIAKANSVEMRRLEKLKNRKLPESEYTTTMKDDGNILEIENIIPISLPTKAS